MRRLLFLCTAIIGMSMLLSCSSTNSTTTYQVSISATPAEGGSVSPSGGAYDEGTSLEISAMPTGNWRFVRWEGGYSGTGSSATVTVDSDKNIKAVFTKKEYALTINTDGEGTVDETVVENKSKDYEHGTVVELMANAAEGWKFVEWQGVVTGSENPKQITVDQAKEVTAVFEKKSYELTVNTEGQGAVEEKVVQAKTYEFGTVVELTANPAEGWKFVEWKGAVTVSNNPTQITVDEAKEVTAVFEKKSFALTVNMEGEGSVTKDPDQDKYKYETTVSLTANAAEGWKFVEWKGDKTSTDAAINVKMNQAKEVTAVFQKKSYPLSVTTDGEGTVEEKVVKAKSYEHGTRIELTATSAEGWQFIEWQGAVTGSENPKQITVDQAKEVTAVFEKKSYELTVNTEGQGAVEEKVVQAKTYEFGTVVELTANPAEGWKFVEWKGAVTGTDNPAQITVDKAKEVTAVFEKKSFAVTVNTEGEGSVTKNPDQESYIFESNLELEASPSTGYQFVEWQGDIESTENPVTVSVDTDPDFTAVFEKENYSLTINTVGEGTVAKDPNQTEYDFNSTVNLTANPADGWEFVEWQGDISVTENSAQITIDEPKEVTAVFEKAVVVTKNGKPPKGRVTFFQAGNASNDVVFAVTKEATNGDGSQGIWVSEDNGDTWTKTSNLVANFITIASKNPNLVIAGGDNGYVISTDGGHRWTSGVINDPTFGNPIILEDAASTSTNDAIYVASPDAMAPGVYRSTDLGNTWTQTLSETETGSKTDAQIYHVYVSPSNENIIYAATTRDHNIWKSTNRGNSFVSINGGIGTSNKFVFTHGLSVNKSNANQLFVDKNISDDGGQTWTQRTKISPENTLWVNGKLVRLKDKNIYVSTNFGSSWTEIIKISNNNFSLTGFISEIFISQNKLYFVIEDQLSNPVFTIYSINLSLIKDKLKSL